MSDTDHIHRIPVSVTVGGPERAFSTIARDAEGTWTAGDASLSNDGPSFIIRSRRAWEPVVSAVVSTAVRFATSAFGGATFIDCKGHIGWFASIAAESGASDIYLVETQRAYSDVAMLNIRAASASARTKVFGSLEDACVESAASTGCVVRLHGVHYDSYLSSFLRLASCKHISVAVVDFFPRDLRTYELLDFIVACTSVFYIISLGPVESTVVPSDERFFKIIHEHNARERIKESESTGFVALMIRKDEVAHGFISHISASIEALIKKSHSV
jgi:hypothetical protein